MYSIIDYRFTENVNRFCQITRELSLVESSDLFLRFCRNGNAFSLANR